MPQRLAKAERDRLQARLNSRVWDRLQVDALVVAALVDDKLREALAERKLRPADRDAFRAGFLAGAEAFWDHVLRSRERLRAAQNGLRHAAADRRPPDLEAVRRVAVDYRRRHPRASQREVAAHVGRQLGRTEASVRHLLQKLAGS